MKNIEKLNAVLAVLYDVPYLTFPDIAERFSKISEMDSHIIDRILKKLSKDHYAVEWERTYSVYQSYVPSSTPFENLRYPIGMYDFLHNTDIQQGTTIEAKETVYSITWEGQTLHELGGYTYLAQEQLRLEADKKQVQTIANGQLLLTGILALGALIASLYYLLEIAVIAFQDRDAFYYCLRFFLAIF